MGDLAAEASPGNFHVKYKYAGPAGGGLYLVGGDGKGIQCVAETVVHELNHLIVYGDTVANTFPTVNPDNDNDNIADVLESNYQEMVSNPADPDSYNMKNFAPSYFSYGDDEVRCRLKEIGFIKFVTLKPNADWANPGCQSKIQFGPPPK